MPFLTRRLWWAASMKIQTILFCRKTSEISPKMEANQVRLYKSNKMVIRTKKTEPASV